MSAATALNAHESASADRRLFAAAADPEGCFATDGLAAALRAEIARIAQSVPAADLGESLRSVSEWASGETERYLKGCVDLTDGTRAVLARRAALGCAPLALVSGAWLQWLSSAATADDPRTMSVLALYAADVGVGHPRASRGAHYLTLLRSLELSESAVPASRIASDGRIADWAFRLPAVLLAAGRRPRELEPEILGADLCLRSAGLLAPLALVRQEYPHAVDWNVLDPGIARARGEGGLAKARDSVEMLIDASGPQSRERVLAGFRWAFAELSAWNGRLRADLDAARDPAYEMAELLRLRGREGSVYHRNFQIAGRSLSSWLGESSSDPAGLLAALAGSRVVKPGRSEASSLVNGLIGEHGPMFRVFAPEDVEVLRRWIDSLPAGSPDADGERPDPVRTAGAGSTEDQAGPAGPRTPITLPPAEQAIQAGPTPRISLRDAYHGLVWRNDDPRLRRFALDYVNGWLARARTGLDEGETVLPAAWEPSGLRGWLLVQHDKHGSDFDHTAEQPIPSRAALVDSTLQLAPLTLIDGSWLQGFTDYEHASSEIGSFLFETYWDELGNGIARLNHPLIYRQVLAEMGIELPPTGAPEFAGWPAFRDKSFELPVYWLAIGRFPQRFLPEILGLNLAMELSGVGGTYRRAHLALKRHGFSTRFVDVHNTIDNVATGHSAWAADAVDTHLATVRATSGTRAQAEVWDRVRAGFRSLSPPDGRRARRAHRAAAGVGAPR
jgi:Iron-containing redox enzyme